MDLTSSQSSSLQVAHNSCIRFIHGDIPFIPSSDILTRLTHRRLQLGWLTLESRRHLQLACQMYSVVSSHTPSYLYSDLKIRNLEQLQSRPIRTIPHLFTYKAPHTQSWLSSFHISSQSFLNTLGITSFSLDQTKQFKTWLYRFLIRAEIDEWRQQSILHSYHPLAAFESLPNLNQNINLSTFTFTDRHLHTPGFHYSIPFITSRHIHPSSISSAH